ncbi:MAG: DsbA family protein, partial [Myxococcales bacterium]|nr:DsbA family protein [Myxococcales bacterium]
RWAAWCRLPFRFPSRFPTHSLKALRLYLALPEDRRAHFREATFRACWADDRDITDEQVLAECVGDEAIAREALARAGSDDVKAALRASTESAAARGVFGVPTFIVGDELFWGQDRLELVLDALLSR